jgi:CheY-like chemotaxis protein
LRDTVETAGHIVEESRNGVEALGRLAGRPAFDLVITEVLLPVVDGLELIKILVERDSAPKIIAVSGGGPGLPAHIALTAAQVLGADAILYRPHSNSELTETVERVLAE